jgi:hypothetical protein
MTTKCFSQTWPNSTDLFNFNAWPGVRDLDGDTAKLERCQLIFHRGERLCGNEPAADEFLSRSNKAAAPLRICQSTS